MASRFAKTLIHCAVLNALILGPAQAADSAAPAATPAPNPAAGESGASDSRRTMIELRNALTERPDDADLRAQLGAVYLELGDVAAAGQELQKAIDLGRDDFATKLLLARVWLHQGKLREVLTDTDLNSADTPEDKAAAAVLRGEARLASNETAGAKTEFEAALAALSRYAPAHLGLARAKMQAKDYAGAELSLRDAAGGLNADAFEVAKLRGDLASVRGQYADAARAYQEALKYRPGSVGLMRDLTLAQLAQGLTTEAEVTLARVSAAAPKAPETLYLKALLAYQQKDYARANEQAQAVLSQTVANPPAMFLAGASAYFLDHYQQAREHLAQYWALAPQDETAARLLGAALMRLGEPAEAYRVLRPLADTHGQDVAVLAVVGSAAAASGKTAEGTAYLQRALALAPDNKAIKAQLAAARVQEGSRQGFEELTRLAQTDPELAALALPAAADLIGRGEYAEAANTAAGFSKAHPDEARGWAVQGIAQVGAGDLDAAEVSFRKALAIDPKDTDANLGLADIRNRRGNPQEALAILEKTLADQPGNRLVLTNLAGLENATGQGERAVGRLTTALKASPGDPDLSTALARLYLQQRRPQAALDALAAATNPQAPQVALVRGQAELAAARTDSAIATLKGLAAAHPNAVEARLALARAYQRARDWPGARAQLDAALAQAPKDPQVRIAAVRGTLGDPKASAEQAAAAVKALQELARIAPEDPQVLELRGLFAARTGRPDEARTALEAAHAALKTSDTAQSLAAQLADQGRTDQAVALLRDWVSANPEDTPGRVLLARLELGAGNYRGAAEDLGIAARQHAEGAELGAARAWALALAGRTDEAAPLAAEALRRAPKDPLAIHATAVVYLAQGKGTQAAEVLRPLLAATTTPSPRLQLDYARALLATNDVAGARGALERVLSNAPAKSPEHGEAQALLARLRR